ncbi:MAG: tetratricopeptide repeat protein [Planctomycetota bacterium]
MTERRNSFLIILVLSLLAFWCEQAAAQFQDEVDVRTARASAHVTLKCRITDYNGQSVRLVSTSGEQTYPIAEVVAVRYAKLPQHVEAEKLLATAKNDEAESQLQKAVAAEPRRWARRELLALLTGCAMRRGDLATAGSRFRQIYESDPHTRHINLMPLAWSNQTFSGLNRSTAIAWLADSKTLNQLMGASLLLYDSQHGHRAREVMRELNRLPERRIRLLAQWQERRLQITSRKASQFDVSRWESSIEELEPALRAGPLYLLAQARLIRQEYDLAAAEFLKLPLVYDSNHPVVARASFEGGQALLRNGLRVEAARIFQETAARYPWSTAAIDARAALKDLLASVAPADENTSPEDTPKP